MISYEYMNNSITRVDYQNRDVESQVAQLQYNDFGIVAHPNPSYGPVLIDLFNYPLTTTPGSIQHCGQKSICEVFHLKRWSNAPR